MQTSRQDEAHEDFIGGSSYVKGKRKEAREAGRTTRPLGSLTPRVGERERQPSEAS